MSFTSRLETSWQLFIRTFSVLRQNPRLLVFPVITFACSLVFILFFFGVLALDFAFDPSLKALFTPGQKAAVDFHYNMFAQSPIIVGLYFFSMFLATFMNVALYNEIMRALRGEAVSIRGGLKFARQRIYSIFLWSLFASVVGWIIRSLSQRYGFISRFVIGLIGTAWSVATVFVIPIIVRDPNPNPLELLRNSAATLKKTWGESLIGYVGISTVDSLVVGLSIVYLFAGIIYGVVYDYEHPWVFFGTIVTWVIGLTLFSMIMGVANSVYRCALYMYATEGVIPEPYTPALMDAAWKVKTPKPSEG